jgi:hypothetical protein
MKKVLIPSLVLLAALVACPKNATKEDPPSAFGVAGVIGACATSGDFTTLCKAINGSPLKDTLTAKTSDTTLLIVNNAGMTAYFSSAGITEAAFLADNTKIIAFVNANTLNGKLPADSLTSADGKNRSIASQGGKYVIDQVVTLDSFSFGGQTNSIYYFSTGQFFKP